MKYLGLWLLGYENFFEKFVKPSAPPPSSYILNIRSLNCDLLITKLEAYRFFKNYLICIKRYLDNRLQKANLNYNFSFWNDIFTGVPLGSILVFLLMH